jgi:hypothetical protein
MDRLLEDFNLTYSYDTLKDRYTTDALDTLLFADYARFLLKWKTFAREAAIETSELTEPVPLRLLNDHLVRLTAKKVLQSYDEDEDLVRASHPDAMPIKAAYRDD